MGREIDLLRNYPKAKRDLSKRLKQKTEQVRNVARKFGKDFFDGDREYEYGGFNYNPKYWSEVVDLRTISPLDEKTIIKSVSKTKKAIITDISNSFCGISSTISNTIYQNINNLKNKLEIISLPFCPEPTSLKLVESFYSDRYTIVNRVLKMFYIKKTIQLKRSSKPDVPGDWFEGPF